MDGESLSQQQRAQALEAVRASGCNRVKLAVCDIDGILRGKVIHADRFPAVLDNGFGFSVFGCDLNDRPYDDDHLSGRGVGFPDANVRLDPSSLRNVPWDEVKFPCDAVQHLTIEAELIQEQEFEVANRRQRSLVHHCRV